MFLRAAIVIVFMLNLGAAGWWLLQPSVSAAPAALQAPPLTLLSEAPVVSGAAQPKLPTVDAESASPASVDALPSAEAAPPENTAPAAASAPICLRFGPFAETAARTTAAKALETAGVKPVAHGRPAVAARGWKVFLPPQASAAAAQALAERLKSAGVSDLFVMTKDAEANSIALGRFSSEVGARRRQAELQGKGFSAQVEPVGGTPAQLWLDARLPETVTPAALAAVAPSQQLDCSKVR